MRETTSIVEAERAAIAAEIHDGLLPYLYAAAAKLSAVQKSLGGVPETPPERSSEQLDERLADVADWIDRSREVARALMNGISYPPLALADPLAAAKAFLDQFAGLVDDEGVSDNQPAEIFWGWDGGNSPLADRLSQSTAIAVYRLTTEFTRNALRHASASHIEVSTSIVGETAIVQISDDGCGFDPRAVDSSTSHGLALARQRAAAAGVDLDIQSNPSNHAAAATEPNSGTRVTLRIAFPTGNISEPQIEHEQQAPR